MRLCVGDRVQVRKRDDEAWLKVTIEMLVDGRPILQQPDGYFFIYSYEKVQLLVIA